MVEVSRRCLGRRRNSNVLVGWQIASDEGRVTASFAIRRHGTPLKKFGEYPCYSRVTARTRIQATFPGLPA